MLAAARCGDLYQADDEEALAVDSIVLGLSDATLSPIRGLGERSDEERWERCVEYLFEHLPEILAGERAPWRALWEPVLEDLRRDRARLATATREDDVDRDLCVWSTREELAAGRHALFSACAADRVLVLAARDGGPSVRLIVSTASWFDLPGKRSLPRPDLVRLAARLNELEGCAPTDLLAWRAQPLRNASPELWFGRDALAPFAERNDALAPTALDPDRLRSEIVSALPVRTA